MTVSLIILGKPPSDISLIPGEVNELLHPVPLRGKGWFGQLAEGVAQASQEQVIYLKNSMPDLSKKPAVSREKNLRELFFSPVPVSLAGIPIRREAFRALPPFDLRLSLLAETWLWIHLLLKGEMLEANPLASPLPQTADVKRQLAYESVLLREAFLKLDDFSEFLSVFPETNALFPGIAAGYQRWQPEYAHFLLAVLGLKNQGASQPLMLFSYTQLHRLMGDPSLRQKLAEDFDFHLKDYFNLIEEKDVFGIFGPPAAPPEQRPF